MHAILNSWAYINVHLISERTIIPSISLMCSIICLYENRKCKKSSEYKGSKQLQRRLSSQHHINLLTVNKQEIKLIRVLLISFLAGFSIGKTDHSIIIDFLTLLHVL